MSHSDWKGVKFVFRPKLTKKTEKAFLTPPPRVKKAETYMSGNEFSMRI